MFRQILLGICALLTMGTVAAQGKVKIVADEAVVKAENNRLQNRRSDEKLVQGYRILIGFTSNKEKAEQLKSDAQKVFEDRFSPQLVYDEPNFKIYVGAYTNVAEADEALGEIRRDYPNAKKIKMPIKTLKK